MYGANGGEEFLRFDVFEQESGSPGGNGAVDKVLVIEGGKHNDLGVWEFRQQPFGGGDAVDARHLDIHEHDIGRLRAGEVEDFIAIGCLPGNV